MAVAKDNNNVKAATTTKTSIDKCGLCVALTTIVVILIVVIVGVCVRFLLDESLSRIILISFICFLLVFGIIVVTFLEIRRRRAKNKAGVITLRNGLYQNIQPSAPQDTSWEYSNRATVQA